MEAILVKVFALALALSQVTTRPDDVKTHFDPIQDRAEVTQLLSAGCAHMRKAFDIEHIDLDGLIETAMVDTRADGGDAKGFHGLNFNDLHTAYRQFCKNETVEKPVVDISELIEFYNTAAANLPDHTRLKNLKLPGVTTVLDGRGAKYAEVFEPQNRRRWIALAEIPANVQHAFIAAEDKRFYSHHGIDERSVIRAFINTMGDSGRRQGGSTITQQVVKNLLVGDTVSYERKMREIIVASRVERDLGKDQILEDYLNAIYLGRGAWGIEMAAQSYFGKPAKNLSLAEGAFLAGLAKGPNYYNSAKYRSRAQERLTYVLTRMQEDNVITKQQMDDAIAQRLTFAAYPRPRRESGFHIVDYIGREAKAMANIGSLTTESYSVRSTIQPQLQVAAETALQNGLANYEQRTGRVRFLAAEGNLTDAIKRLQADPAADRSKPFWQQALQAAKLPLYDVHWPTAVVLERVPMRGYDSIRIGLADGRVLPLSTASTQARGALSVNDVIFVSVTEGKGKTGTRVDLRTRPTVQAAAVVLENQTGRILAMAGGFSYPLSQLNRVTQSRRQPGSSFKPMTYLAALAQGLQPNTLVEDTPITLPPIGRTNYYGSAKDYWSPKNYDNNFSGAMTLRRALENSKNLVTAHLLDGGIASTPEESLDKVCELAKEAQIYSQCERYYPFVLGAQPVRPLDLAAFYAAVANEGGRPTPHVIESIQQNGKTLYKEQIRQVRMASADRAAFFQLKTMLQGVVARGTARSIARDAPYIGGKTGTSDDENDGWFAAFSNDVTVVVWVGYDNARGKRTLGAGQTGSRVAIPIFEPIMQAVWASYAPKTPLRGPSPEAARNLAALPIDYHSGQRLTSGDGRGERATAGNRGAFTEYFRRDPSGNIADTQHQLVSGYGDANADTDSYDNGDWNNRPFFGSPFGRNDNAPYYPPQSRTLFPPFGWNAPPPQPAPEVQQRGAGRNPYGYDRHRTY